MTDHRPSKPVLDRGTNFCRECGMHISSPSEYHPFAACLMFKASGDPDAVTANLMAVVQHGQEKSRNALRQKSEQIERLQLTIQHFQTQSSERTSEPPEEPHSADHLQRYTDWLVKEMPAGTVVGDPAWWARKLLAAACVFADEAPQPWRSVATDPPPAVGVVVLVFTGEAYSAEYGDEVNAADHKLWMEIPPLPSPTKEPPRDSILHETKTPGDRSAGLVTPSIDLLDELRKQLSGKRPEPCDHDWLVVDPDRDDEKQAYCTKCRVDRPSGETSGGT